MVLQRKSEVVVLIQHGRIFLQQLLLLILFIFTQPFRWWVVVTISLNHVINIILALIPTRIHGLIGHHRNFVQRKKNNNKRVRFKFITLSVVRSQTIVLMCQILIWSSFFRSFSTVCPPSLIMNIYASYVWVKYYVRQLTSKSISNRKSILFLFFFVALAH